MAHRFSAPKPLLPLVFAALVAACGGGGDAPATATEREKPKAVFTPTGPIPLDANVKGMWSPLVNWPLIMVHAALMPDGRLLTYGTTTTGVQTASGAYDIWDPEGGLSGGHLTMTNTTGIDIFCSSQVLLPDGSGVFIAGGDQPDPASNVPNNNSTRVSWANNGITRGNDLLRARWYSTSTTLLNGETYIQGGSGGGDLPEIRSTAGVFRLLSGANTSGIDGTFPRNFIAPDGRIFGYDGAGRMYYINPTGTGSITQLAQTLPAANAGWDASAAMFAPGRILQFGGNSNGAAVIDIRSGTPVVTATQSMATQRRIATATLLADGKVLATGGSRTWNANDQVAYTADIWNPVSGTWTVGAAAVKPRLYHSNAILLPDATVLVGGGGAPAPADVGNQLNAELYFPPYLFTNTGTLAARPSISTAPTVMDVGKTYTVATSSSKPVARVVMVRNGSATHGWNMEQRFVDLTFTNNAGTLAVQAPTKAADAPPGFYMLFAIDNAGVPSVAKMVRVNVAANPNPATVPSLTNPGDRSNTLGTAINLQLQATDPNGDTLRYSATGLPPGLSVNPSTGLITGTLNTAGSYNVTVSASDGVNTDSKSFVWTVSALTGNLQIHLPMPSATLSGGTVSYTGSTSNGVNTQYRWNFGDGSPTTAWSSSATISHTYTKAGLYTVRLSAIDARNVETSVTVQQTIYLPATTGKPVASGNMVLQQPTTGNARLWVVNQDNDSVSVFDAVTRAKLAEVAVGSAPRAIAQASNGLMWVSNKLVGTVSVIDPATFAVSRTITLPRGSQPFGLAASRNGYMLIVLEGSGQLLKYDSALYTQTASLSVGANPRHVSLAGDASTAYVSRFITPPLTGEGTAFVTTTSGGGEVRTINSTTMALVRTLTLAHGNLPDAENQGSGLPNYLGAAVVSPDGTQAFVPGKLDNITRGMVRNELHLNFQNTVRAISARLDLVNNREDLAARIDHDNASLTSAVAFDPRGVFLFAALETSREVAILDAHSRRQIMRIDVGRAPQGLAVSSDGGTLYVSNFMDRTVAAYDLRALRDQGAINVPLLGSMSPITTEKLSATVLKGKQFFYDARDTRLARDRYMSCASCHNDGGHDGRVWDLTGFGEGLRNTINLRGRGGMAHGWLHWSNNFDEVQDFEGQIRNLAGGTGLMSDTAYLAGTRSQPLGDKKAGQSADLDALAAYVASLNTFAPAPERPSATALSTAATAGKTLFNTLKCASCHSGVAFTGSGNGTPSHVGTIKPSSGQRLGGALTGIDAPTLRDVWATAPYLHDGSAPTLQAAVRAHVGVSITDADLNNLVQYLKEIGSDEAAPANPAGGGTGLKGEYFNNTTLSGTPVLTLTQAINFNTTASPGTGVNADNFSARWSGRLVAPATGSYTLRTYSDAGARVWLKGQLIIDNWVSHAATYNASARINLVAGEEADLRVEYFETTGSAVMSLQWVTPGNTAYAVVPVAQLKLPTATVQGLKGEYFNNISLSGTPALTRIERPYFDWAGNAPGPGVNDDNFSVRWSGFVTAPAAGSYVFRTWGDDGMRLWVNGVLVINDWNEHSVNVNDSAPISLSAGQKVSIRMEFFDACCDAVAELWWLPPGAADFVPLPLSQLSTN